MTDLKNEFWTRIAQVRAVILGAEGTGPLVAMSPQLDDDLPGHIWFITAKDTDLGKAVSDGEIAARMVVADAGAGLYGDVEGTLSPSKDREALDEVWSFVADAWFEGGKADPDVRLLCFTPSSAELSVTPTSGARFLFEIAKANITGENPDAGAQGVVSF